MRGSSPVMCWWMATMLMPPCAHGFEYGLQLCLGHGEVAVDDRVVIGAGEGRPGVDPHRLADWSAMH